MVIKAKIGEGIESLYNEGNDTIFGIIPHAENIEILLKDGPVNMERACENIGRLLKKTMS